MVKRILIVIGALEVISKGLVKGLVNFEIKRTSRDHQKHSIIKIGQNTEKSPGDSRRLSVTQSSMKIHQLTLV